MSESNSVQNVRGRFHKILEELRLSGTTAGWAKSCFEHGLKLVDELEALAGPLAGRRVLDIGAGRAGHLLALFARGARCVGADKYDFDYGRLLAEFNDDRLRFARLDAFGQWPFGDASFDVVFSMELLEMVEDLDAFFGEIVRVLRPGGIAMINTGVALKGIRRDPVYGLPVVSALPTRMRRWVAERVFRRGTDFRLSSHTIYSADLFRRYARRYGMDVLSCKFAGSPIMARVENWPLAGVWKWALRRYAFDYILIVPRSRMPVAQHARRPRPPADSPAPRASNPGPAACR